MNRDIIIKFLCMYKIPYGIDDILRWFTDSNDESHENFNFP